MFDISRGTPVQKQVIPVPNTFIGLAFAPDGKQLLRHRRRRRQRPHLRLGGAAAGPRAARRSRSATGRGQRSVHQHPGLRQRGERAVAAGIASRATARSWSSPTTRTTRSAWSTSPQRQDAPSSICARARSIPRSPASPGGEFPYWVAVGGNATAYVSSIRDREIVVVDLERHAARHGAHPARGQPEQDAAQPHQTPAAASRRTTAEPVYVIDTRRNAIVDASRPRRRAACFSARTSPPRQRARTAWRSRPTSARSTSPTAAATRWR